MGSEGAVADHGVGGVRIDVEDRGEVDVDADGPKLFAHRHTFSIGEMR